MLKAINSYLILDSVKIELEKVLILFCTMCCFMSVAIFYSISTFTDSGFLWITLLAFRIFV